MNTISLPRNRTSATGRQFPCPNIIIDIIVVAILKAGMQGGIQGRRGRTIIIQEGRRRRLQYRRIRVCGLGVRGNFPKHVLQNRIIYSNGFFCALAAAVRAAVVVVVHNWLALARTTTGTHGYSMDGRRFVFSFIVVLG